ncbi:unnamed protein product [Phyllotreta striolata]|uniref:Uncharacterized protein n=1 Tax=Phyllotreta striolata TaxID=444603 RepID=A0A9N9TQJ9_PHYSR|nr:unnamed protein product [Phyllotreta striolata]
MSQLASMMKENRTKLEPAKEKPVKIMSTKINVMDKNIQTEGDSSKAGGKVVVNGQTAGTSTDANVCTPHVCRQARQNYAPPDLANDSPWNRKKTYFFVGTFCVFIAWIVIYSTISSFGLL